ELCAGPWTRAPQGSLSEAKAASVARRAPPGQPFAATTVNAPKQTFTNVRNGPRVDTKLNAFTRRYR
ncbi:MAG: hypothetical protein Q7U73_09460, partial [Rubrivivax sp.]|nr:hypothetical protein [Rubrivivax sp.]